MIGVAAATLLFSSSWALVWPRVVSAWPGVVGWLVVSGAIPTVGRREGHLDGETTSGVGRLELQASAVSSGDGLDDG